MYAAATARTNDLVTSRENCQTQISCCYFARDYYRDLHRTLGCTSLE